MVSLSIKKQISTKKQISYVFKPVVFVVLLMPILWLAWHWFLLLDNQPNELTANPIEYTNRYLGGWGLKYILLTLLVRPFSELTSMRKPMLFRRMVGLFAFSYILLHFTSYIVLDHFFNWPEIWQDIVKRNFITIGMLALLALLPLAFTSTNAMIKKLGGQNWKRLHMLIYPISILGLFHFTMMRKGDQLEPKIYWLVLGLLLAYRLYVFWHKHHKDKQTKTDKTI
jgi:sulfoxide reductase heme-binding subunit YedZ